MKFVILIAIFASIVVAANAQIRVKSRPDKPTFDVLPAKERLNYRPRRSPDTNVNAGIDVNNGRPSWNAGVGHTIYENKHGKIGVQAGVGGEFGRRPQSQIHVGGEFRFPG